MNSLYPIVYPIVPVPAPRQVRKDKFNPSDAVLRYRAFKDEVRIRHVPLPSDFYHVVFVLPMPASWSAKRIYKMAGTAHRCVPDRDNLEKALLDAVFPDCDGHCWNGWTSKIWGFSGSIIIHDQPIERLMLNRSGCPSIPAFVCHCGFLRDGAIVEVSHA